jgi:hypothetical protein
MEEEGGGGVRDHPHGPRTEQDGPALQLCCRQVEDKMGLLYNAAADR